MQDMLRIMDVASALRRERETAEAQLDLDTVKARLRERLLATAVAAGETVTPAEVDAAIEHYFRRQHRYADPPAGWGSFWAHVWVARNGVLLGLAFAVLLIGGSVALAGWLSGRPAAPLAKSAPLAAIPTAPPQRAPSSEPDSAAKPAPAVDRDWPAFEAALAAARALAADDDARGRVERIAAAGTAAHGNTDVAGLRAARRDLDALRARLEETYEVRIVSRPGEQSGVDRYFDGRLSGYYVIVEAVQPDGRVLPRAIRNAETGRTDRVTKWGEQVGDAVWQRIVADKQADGVVDEALFAAKRAGVFDEQVVLDDGNGRPLARRRQITAW